MSKAKKSVIEIPGTAASILSDSDGDYATRTVNGQITSSTTGYEIETQLSFLASGSG